ncbi:MAG: hypothetical protein FWF36_05130 [Propionibacteriaceae bacterium]|nr:hypothetical protein [Propionibacteriaceae bacterium]
MIAAQAAPVLAAEHCGVCGAALRQRQTTCVDCGAPATNAAFPALSMADAQAFTVESSKLAKFAVFFLDAFSLAVFAAAGAYLFGGAERLVRPGWSAHWMLVGAAVGLAAGLWCLAAAYKAVGWGLGGWVIVARCVDSRWLLPTLPFTGLRSGARWRMVDVRYGPDPIVAMLEPWNEFGSSGGRQAEDESRRATPRHGISAGAVVLVFESGQLHWFTGECMIGRSPEVMAGGVLSLPDLGRKLSPNHVRLADIPAGGVSQVWATDQDSATGTWLERPSGLLRLAPFQPTPLATGDVVIVGDSRFTVERN